MSEAGCAFCTVVAALEQSDTCPASTAGQVLRKVRDLPASRTNHTPRLPSPEEYADTLAAIRRHLA
jgi:hypothetical protein